MGWIDRVVRFLRRNVTSQSSSAVEVVSLDGLDSWLTVQVADVIAQYNLSTLYKEYFQKLRGRRLQLSSQLGIWEERLASSPQRSSSIRDIFSDTHSLLELLNLPASLSIIGYLRIDSEFEQQIDELLASIEQSDFATHFGFLYGKEAEQSSTLVNPLLQELLSLNSLRERFSAQLQKSGFRRLELLRKRVKALLPLREELNTLQEKFSEKEKRYEQAQQKLTEKQELATSSRDSSTHKEVDELNEKRASIEARKDALATEVIFLFRDVKDVLDMYQKEHGSQELITEYIEEPLRAFKNDAGLTILHTLSHCKALLSSGMMTHTDSDASRERLSQIIEGDLEQLYSRYLALQKEYESIRSKIFKNGQSQKLAEVEYKLNHFKDVATKLEQETTLLSEAVDEKKEELEKEKSLFENLVKVGLGKHLHITY